MLNLVIHFDVTGSMSSVSRIVANNISNLIDRLNESLPGSKISLMATGNYANGPKPYLTTELLPVNDDKNLKQLQTFLTQNFYGLGGGGSRGFKGSSCSACYELLLAEAANLEWDENVAKVVVVIGDEEPSDLARGVDWRTEVTNLASKGVVIYGVQCLKNSGRSYFYKDMASNTNGLHLELAQFGDILELITAIAYKHHSPDSLEAFALELSGRAKMNRNLLSQFSLLMGDDDLGKKLNLSFTDYSLTKDKDLVPVDPSRFQVMNVPRNQDIKSFVLDTGALFKIGRGFYELMKSEEIQERKEVVLVEKLSGDMWSGSVAREMIGLPLGDRGTISPRTMDKAVVDKYDIFVQSTSNNRKLIGGTKFLYEVEKKS